MSKALFPNAELRAGLAALLGLDSLDNVRSIKIDIVSGDAITVHVQMFVWDQGRLTSVVEQLSTDPERVTNVNIEVTPQLANTEPASQKWSCPAHGEHPHAGLNYICLDCPQCALGRSVDGT